MKCFIAICLICFALGVTALPIETVKVETVLKNPQNFDEFINCFINKDKCDDYQEMADWAKQAIKERCSNCDENEKDLIQKTVTFVQTNYPNVFEQVLGFIDPNNKYVDGIKKMLNV